MTVPVIVVDSFALCPVESLAESLVVSLVGEGFGFAGFFWPAAKEVKRRARTKNDVASDRVAIRFDTNPPSGTV